MAMENEEAEEVVTLEEEDRRSEKSKHTNSAKPAQSGESSTHKAKEQHQDARRVANAAG